MVGDKKVLVNKSATFDFKSGHRLTVHFIFEEHWTNDGLEHKVILVIKGPKGAAYEETWLSERRRVFRDPSNKLTFTRGQRRKYFTRIAKFVGVTKRELCAAYGLLGDQRFVRIWKEYKECAH